MRLWNKSFELDAYRAIGSLDKKLITKSLRYSHILKLIRLFRLHQESSGLAKKIFAKMYHRSSIRAGIDIPETTSIGQGLKICHGYGIVVNKNAVIGKNVTIFHGVTIGQGDQISDDGERNSGCPVIGDCVWIGPNAIVVGGVTIGKSLIHNYLT